MIKIIFTQAAMLHPNVSSAETVATTRYVEDYIENEAERESATNEYFDQDGGWYTPADPHYRIGDEAYFEREYDEVHYDIGSTEYQSLPESQHTEYNLPDYAELRAFAVGLNIHDKLNVLNISKVKDIHAQRVRKVLDVDSSERSMFDKYREIAKLLPGSLANFIVNRKPKFVHQRIIKELTDSALDPIMQKTLKSSGEKFEWPVSLDQAMLDEKRIELATQVNAVDVAPLDATYITENIMPQFEITEEDNQKLAKAIMQSILVYTAHYYRNYSQDEASIGYASISTANKRSLKRVLGIERVLGSAISSTDKHTKLFEYHLLLSGPRTRHYSTEIKKRHYAEPVGDLNAFISSLKQQLQEEPLPTRATDVERLKIHAMRLERAPFVSLLRKIDKIESRSVFDLLRSITCFEDTAFEGSLKEAVVRRRASARKATLSIKKAPQVASFEDKRWGKVLDKTKFLELKSLSAVTDQKAFLFDEYEKNMQRDLDYVDNKSQILQFELLFNEFLSAVDDYKPRYASGAYVVAGVLQAPAPAAGAGSESSAVLELEPLNR